jgi:hypothetical protein
MLREREAAIRDLLAAYNPLAALSLEAEPDEDHFVLPGWMLLLPRELRRPPINFEELEPAPEEVDRMREALAVPDAQTWWESALELGIVGATGRTNPGLKQPLRRRARELGSIELAMDELVAEEASGSEGRQWS